MKRRKSAGKFVRQKVLVVGLGSHGGGVATVQWLVKHGAQVCVTDRQNRQSLRISVAQLRSTPVRFSLGREFLDDVRWADWVVQNPGVPSENKLIREAHRLGKPVFNEASLFFSTFTGRSIGITGTRGKTTTTLLIAHLMRGSKRRVFAAGNLRDVPMLSIVDRLQPRDTAVVELSSFQLEGLASVRRSPTIAVWTNLHVDHLNRYPTMAAYAAAKANILRYQTPESVAVLNADSAAVRQAARLTKGTIVWYGKKKPRGAWSVYLQDQWVREQRNGRTRAIVPLGIWSLPGEHQQHNLLAAIAAALAAGVTPAMIVRALPKFSGIPHRQEIVRTWRGHRWINDTTATSPEGALAALQTFPEAIYIMGGTDKALDFSPLVTKLLINRPTIIFLPGSATEKLRRALRKGKYRGETKFVPSMGAAVRLARRLVRPGQDVVLTPGAASFGLFRHEFDRGEQFVRAVKALK